MLVYQMVYVFKYFKTLLMLRSYFSCYGVPVGLETKSVYVYLVRWMLLQNMACHIFQSIPKSRCWLQYLIIIMCMYVYI